MLYVPARGPQGPLKVVNTLTREVIDGPIDPDTLPFPERMMARRLINTGDLVPYVAPVIVAAAPADEPAVPLEEPEVEPVGEDPIDEPEEIDP